MRSNLPVALLTQALERWSSHATQATIVVCATIVLAMLWAALRPARVRSWALVLPAILSIALLGMFERVREFVRKPYAIAGYLYSNGYRVEDYPLLQRDGLLAHATYTPVRVITAENELVAGREVFNLACTRCHTVDGINGIRPILQGMYGRTDANGEAEPWQRDVISAYVGSMHNVRPYMPPFPGSDRERDALAAWLVSLQTRRDVIDGAQVTGVVALPRPDRGTSSPSSVH
jgi:mono/diheme cytochrome c family protein